MGKRGPKPNPNKAVVLSTRMQKELRDALEKARRSSGLTLSSEIQNRLSRTFKEDERRDEIFGNREIFGVMKAIAEAIFLTTLTTAQQGHKGSWLADPFAFDEAVKAANKIFEAFRPDGAVVPPEGLQAIAQILPDYPGLGVSLANGVLLEIASDSPPTSSAGKKERRGQSLRRDLSRELVGRVKSKGIPATAIFPGKRK